MDSIMLSQIPNDKNKNSFLSRNISSLTNQSKIYAKDFMKFQQPKFQSEIIHINCNCYHCQNNTKPIQTQFYPRIQAENQYNLQTNQAYTFILNKLIDFVGNLKVPDTFCADNSTFLFNNQKNKIKIKENLMPVDVKKIFDTKKNYYQKIWKDQQIQKVKEQSKIRKSIINPNIINSTISIRQQQSIQNSTLQNSINKKQRQALKQVAIVHYKNNFSQIVTDSLLSKLLAKRKNDIFWQEICSISLIPPFKQKQMFYHEYSYERNLKTIPQIQEVIKKVSQTIDIQDYCDYNNPQADIIRQKVIDNKYNFSSKLKQLKSFSLFNKRKILSNLSQFQQQENDEFNYDKQMTENVSKQIISFIQTQHFIRILSGKFKYVIDYQGNIYLVSIQKLILVNLKKNQLKIIHDRLQQLQPIGLQELCSIKSQNQTIQIKTLRAQLVELMIGCLQNRKKQLNQSQIVYKRLSNQNFIIMFKRFFPEFNQNQLFLNKNWKNQFQQYLLKCRNKINKMIRQDQGIRILKRFGIVFYRTWN